MSTDSSHRTASSRDETASSAELAALQGEVAALRKELKAQLQGAQSASVDSSGVRREMKLFVDRAKDVSDNVTKVTDKMDNFTLAAGNLNLRAWGFMAMALVPLLVSLVVVAFVLGFLGEATGLGPMFQFFSEKTWGADTWWKGLLWGVADLAFIGATGWVVVMLGKKLHEWYSDEIRNHRG